MKRKQRRSRSCSSSSDSKDYERRHLRSRSPAHMPWASEPCGSSSSSTSSGPFGSPSFLPSFSRMKRNNDRSLSRSPPPKARRMLVVNYESRR